MSGTRKRGLAAVLVCLSVVGGACKGSDDKASLPRTSTTRRLASTSTTNADDTSITAVTSSTSTTQPASPPSPSPSSTPKTTTVSSAYVAPGGSVEVASREPMTEKSDGGGSFTYGLSPEQHSASRTSDPGALDFTIDCEVHSDGHGVCISRLTNHATRAAEFPGGLRVTVTFTRDHGDAITVDFDARNITRLPPDAYAQVEGTFDLTEADVYHYSASAVVQWP